ncbi:toprim domain-containing protein, partial [Burkholderia contaminans]|nr:toprim domain-containing protein [Burkholderia contaminans]
VSEVIVATNATADGEATSMYLSRLLKPAGIKVTRLARGLAVGAPLSYASSGPCLGSERGYHCCYQKCDH